VVVLSGSMEPGFYRGDILFLNMGNKPVRVGEVVVFNLDGRDIPIVHRVIKVCSRLDIHWALMICNANFPIGLHLPALLIDCPFHCYCAFTN
jgi:Peptidase S24-like